VDVEQAADGAEADDAGRAPERDGFDDVFGSAIARAVRRAVDGVGREVDDGDGGGPDDDDGSPSEQQWVQTLASSDRARAVEALRAAREAEGPPPLPAAGTTDPYQLLGIDRRADWAAITSAYKRRARAWHPDGAPADEQARRHELLRDLNAAYAELRVRRGR
jgi:hypothetical protein